jgi:hypothetical protein
MAIVNASSFGQGSRAACRTFKRVFAAQLNMMTFVRDLGKESALA